MQSMAVEEKRCGMSDKIKILVTVPFRDRHIDRLQKVIGNAATIRQINTPATVEDLEDTEIVIGEPTPEVLSQNDSVRWVQMTWAGTDLYTASSVPFPKRAMLTNVAGIAYGHIISQYVVGQILSIAQNFPTYIRQQQQEIWQTAGPVFSLTNKNVLIFGAGDLGQMLAKRLIGFDVHVTGVCRDTSAPREYFDRLVTLDEAEGLLGEADVVANCLPNTPKTAHYLDARRLNLLRRGSILVNVGRGNFIDCLALADILAEGKIRGAALDVTDPEPLPKGHPLWHEPRCSIVPHQAGGAFGKSDETEDRICDVCCTNLAHYLAGEPLERIVIEPTE